MGVTHNTEIQRNQAKFLAGCPPDQRDFHARMFRTGNAAIGYHQQAQLIHDPTLEDFDDWLSGLPDNIRLDMQKQGFDVCKTHLPFTRHVMERRDVGIDDWMKEHLSQEDYALWEQN